MFAPGRGRRRVARLLPRQVGGGQLLGVVVRKPPPTGHDETQLLDRWHRRIAGGRHRDGIDEQDVTWTPWDFAHRTGSPIPFCGRARGRSGEFGVYGVPESS